MSNSDVLILLTYKSFNMPEELIPGARATLLSFSDPQPAFTPRKDLLVEGPAAKSESETGSGAEKQAMAPRGGSLRYGDEIDFDVPPDRTGG